MAILFNFIIAICNSHFKTSSVLNKAIMRRLRLLLFFAVVFCCITSNGQVNNLRIDSLNIPTAHLGDSLATVTVTVHNDSLTSYVGKILFGSRINTDTATIDTLASGAVYYPNYNSLDSIGPHNSVVLHLVFHIVNPPFIVGPSGVVIWPIVNNNGSGFISSTDTLRTTLYVLNPLGEADIEGSNLKVFMDEEQLLIQADWDSKLKMVKVYSVNGSLLTERQLSLSTAINMSAYSEGIYFAEVWFADNSRKVIKVFKAK